MKPVRGINLDMEIFVEMGGKLEFIYFLANLFCGKCKYI